MELAPADVAKRAAAERALAMVEDGMTLGLGSGSTAGWFVRLLAERVREGLSVSCVSTSRGTAQLAGDLGLPLVPINEVGLIALTVDGADEFDPDLNLIKGGGAALLQEKIVAAASERMIVIADEGKQVTTLGAFPLPVEVVRFGWPTTQAAIERLLERLEMGGRKVRLRAGADGPLVTDEGHHILDLHLGRIDDPAGLAQALDLLPGVVEHGLFVGIADAVLVGRADGEADLLRRPEVQVSEPVDYLEQMRNQDA